MESLPKRQTQESTKLGLRPQSVNCLVRVSFALKNGANGRKRKSPDFLNKKTYILPGGYLTCSAIKMLFQLPICHQNKIKVRKFVFIRLFLCIFICVICIYYVCFIYV